MEVYEKSNLEESEICDESYAPDVSTVVSDGCTADFDGSSQRHPTKSEKKRKHYENRVAYLREHRKAAKARHKAVRKKLREQSVVLSSEDASEQSSSVSASDPAPGDRLTKKDRLRLIKTRLQESLVTGQRICVDLGLEHHMSPKECSRLAQQLCRLYGSNRASDEPAHVYFSSLDRSGHLYKECVRKNNGFQDYVVDMTNQSHLDLFPPEDIVYLTPDSPNVLESVERSKVYVLGGLVDESVTKNITTCEAQKANLNTARLPIEEYMRKTDQGTAFSKILSVNQVFDILLNFLKTRDWKEALSSGIPKRKGYVLND